MSITYRLAKGVELTHEEMDTNFRTLDFKDYRTSTNPTADDDSSNGFEVDSKWTNTTTGDVFRCADATATLAVWDLEVQAVDKVVADTDPTDSDSYDFIGQRWINTTVTGNDEVVNKIFIATAVTSNLFTWVQTYPTVSSTGLEAIDEGNGIGWRLIGKDPLEYGDIGKGAVDFSFSEEESTTFGATGTISVAMGYENTASGTASFSMGALSTASGAYSSAIGAGVTSGHDYQAVFGRYNDNKPDTLFEIGDGTYSQNLSNLLELYTNGALHIDKLVDTTANRPTLTKASNIPYYDTDLDAPVWWNGTAWKKVGGSPVMSVSDPLTSETLTDDDFLGREWFVYDANDNNLILKKFVCFRIDTENNWTYWTIKNMYNMSSINSSSNLLIANDNITTYVGTSIGCVDQVYDLSDLTIEQTSLSVSSIRTYLEGGGGSLDINNSTIASNSIVAKTDAKNVTNSSSLTLNGCVIANESDFVIHNDFSGLAVGSSNLLFNTYSMQMNIDLTLNGFGNNYNLGKNTSGKVSCASYTTGDGIPEGKNKIYFPKNSVTKLKGSCVAINEVSGEKGSASYDLVIDVTEAGVITIKSSVLTIDYQDVAGWSLYETVTNNDDYSYLTLGVNGEAGTDTVRANFSFDFTQVHDSEDPDYYYYSS